jgi:hypothetical protein
MKPEQSGLAGRMDDFAFEIVPNTEQASPNSADKEGSQTDMDAWLNGLFDELGY